jgi:hypothetical protein
LGALGKAPVLRVNDWEMTPDRQWQLRNPLPKSMYSRPLAELYGTKSWQFYTVFWPDRIEAAGNRTRNSLLP